METAEFFKVIDAHEGKFLRFCDHQGTMVHSSYHVSEVKAAAFQTVDCGNQVHNWSETILQLWLSNDPDAEKSMRVSRAVEIIVKVSQSIDIDPTSELRIEYGNENFPPVLFHVGEIEINDKEVVVALRPPTTVCKLEERGGCCARPELPEAISGECGSQEQSKCCS